MKRVLFAVLFCSAAVSLLPSRARACAAPAPEGVYMSSVTLCADGPVVPLVNPQTGKGATLHTVCPEIIYDTQASADGMMCPTQPPIALSGSMAVLNFTSDMSDASGSGNNATAVPTATVGCGAAGGIGGSDPISGSFGNYFPGLDGGDSLNNFDMCNGANKDIIQFFQFSSGVGSQINLANKSFTIEMWARSFNVTNEVSAPFSGYNTGTPPHDLNDNNQYLFLSCPSTAGGRRCFGLRKGDGANDGKLIVSFDALAGTPADSDLVSTNAGGTNAGLDDGKWHYIVFYFDSSTNQRSIFIDGEPAGQDATGASYKGAVPACTFVDAITTTGACGSAKSALQDIDGLRITNGLPPSKDLYGFARARYWAGHHYFKVDTSTQTPYPFAAESNNYGSFPGVTWGAGPTTCTNGMKTAVHGDLNVNGQVQTGMSLTLDPAGTNTLAVRTFSTTEKLCKDDLVLAVDNTFVDTPPTPAVPAKYKTTTTLTWDWSYAVANSSYSCNTKHTGYTVTVDTYAPAQFVDTVPAATVGSFGTTTYRNNFYSAHPFLPNSQHCMKMVADYVDPCVGGAPIQSAATPFVCACTLAQTPTNPPAFFDQPTGTSVRLTLDQSPNAPGTQLDVEGSVTGAGGGYVPLSSYAAVPDATNTSTRTVGGLATSSRYYFGTTAQNCDGDKTALRQATGAFSVITQPTMPATFSGTTPQEPVGCGKTQLYYTWDPETTGSGAATQYELRRASDDALLCATATTSCLVTVGGAPTVAGVSQSAYVRAFDSGAPAVAQYSAHSPTVTNTTASSVIPAPTGLSGVAVSPGVQWTWNAPPYLCNNWNYVIYDQHTGAQTTLAANSAASYLQIPLPVNSQSSIKVQATDSVGVASALSASATQYSSANPPTGLTALKVSTSSIVLGWNANGNPSYTRYELGVSPDGVNISSRITLSDNYTALIATVTGLSFGSNYWFTLRAFNGQSGDGSGGQPTSTILLQAATLSTAPVLSGATVDTTHILWSWTATQGSSFYRLFGTPPGGMINQQPQSNGPSFSFLQAVAGPNTGVAAYIGAYNPQSLPNLGTTVYAYSQAENPTGLNWAGVSSRTVTLQWDAGAVAPGNPADTIYEVDITTDPNFNSVVVTRGYLGTLNTVTGLLPATTYWAEVRAINGSGIQGSFVPVAASTVTNPDPAITLSSAPPSAYVPQGDMRGLWHFDVSGGTWTPDSSGYGNTADPTCLNTGCISTPTFSASLPTLSTAVALLGQTSSLVLITDAPQYDSIGSKLSVAAWVNVAQQVQAQYAGIVSRSSWTGTDFLLAIRGNNYYFYAGGTSVVSDIAVQPNAWTRVVGVYDQPANQLRLYVNGALHGTQNGVGGRTTGPWNVAAGNRICVGPALAGGCVAGAYDGGLIGRIDEVMLRADAMTNADAAADYQGASASTLTLPSPNNGVSLYVPPNAFGAPAVIYVSRDPLVHPITVNTVTLVNGLASEPTGQMLVPGSLTEIVPTINGQPFSAPLASSATITMAYADNNNDGIVDGVNPPLSARTLQMYTLDTTVGRWNPLPSTVDTVAHTVTGMTPHFSIFALFGATTIGPTLASVRAYPNPWKRSSNGRFDAPVLTFDNLPQEGSVHVMTLAGERVVDLPFSGPSAGTVQWDGKNFAGRPAASGVYFAYIKSDKTSSTTVLKFAIER